MICLHLMISVILVLISNLFWGVLRQPYSWWLTPLLLISFFFALVILQMLLLLVPAQFVRFTGKPERGSRYFRFMVSITLPMLFSLARVRFCTRGLDKVPANRRIMLVCNHQDNFDPAIILALLPAAQLAFIAKKEIYTDLKLVAKVIHKLHCLPIDRENDREAAKTIIKAIQLVKEDKASIGVFPEGYTSKSGELLPMRNGAFKIAMKASVPIVVCVIDNVRAILPNLLRRRTDVHFRVLDVIEPEQFSGMSATDIGNVVLEKMQTGLTEIRSEKL